VYDVIKGRQGNEREHVTAQASLTYSLGIDSNELTEIMKLLSNNFSVDVHCDDLYLQVFSNPNFYQAGEDGLLNDLGMDAVREHMPFLGINPWDKSFRLQVLFESYTSETLVALVRYKQGLSN